MDEFYYKMLDEHGNLIGLLTCDGHLGEDEFQVEIDDAEYERLHDQLYGGSDGANGG